MPKYHQPSPAYALALALAVDESVDGGSARMFELLQQADAEGDARAAYAMATWYLFGREGAVDADEAKGVAILKALGDVDIAEAQFNLAYAYDEGRGGLRRNERKAFTHYMKAALLGATDACEQVSEFYREGKIVKHDKALAAAWAARAACDQQAISPPYRISLDPEPKA